MDNVWYIHTLEYYSAIENNEILIYATTWINLKKYYAKLKKQDTKGHILYESIYIKFPEEATTWG